MVIAPLRRHGVSLNISLDMLTGALRKLLLVKLLPRRSNFMPPVAEKVQGLHAMTGSTFATFLLCVAMGLAVLLIAVVWERSRRG